MADTTVAVTIGTKVSLGWGDSKKKGEHPTTGYTTWCDCTAHPDLNPARDQIETTTLCQENNHTYTSGLRDFGELEFGSNLTQSTMDMFLDESKGFFASYETQRTAGKYLWICIDIKHINKSYFIPVEPQDFGMPSGEAGSNKYDLNVYFSVIGDAYWDDDLANGYTTPYGSTGTSSTSSET